MAECGDGDSSSGRPYRDPSRHLWTWQHHEEAVQGPNDRLRAWQQQMGRPVICQAPYDQNGTRPAV
ncbi:unnamed protein product [Staurois parvus]|uniref:MHC class I antigen n=1 Tax=Staurois parvus TaxID=386267 RepID=A0ABN9FZN2_9NEOB|nr:unnamed protein product [Staurois parvus]